MTAIVDIEDYAVRRAGGCWLFAIEDCARCSAAQLAVVPSLAPDMLECSTCGAMAASITGVVASGFNTRADAVEFADDFIGAARSDA